MQEYNQLNFVWIAVKWLFGDITNLFKFLYFKRNVKIGLSSVGKMYVFPALLCNTITCHIYDITKISLYVKPRLGCDRFAWFVDVLGKILRCSCLFFHFLIEMPQWCIAYRCTNSSGMKIKKALPLENKELLSKWPAKIRRMNTPVKGSLSTSVLCR